MKKTKKINFILWFNESDDFNLSTTNDAGGQFFVTILLLFLPTKEQKKKIKNCVQT